MMQVAQQRHVSRSVLYAAVCILLLGGLLLRFHGMTTRYLWEDEAYFLKRAAFGMPLTDAPLPALLLRQFVLFAGISPASLYLFAALFGSAAIGCFLLLARQVSSSPMYLLGCLSFFAFSPLAVFYSQAGRVYGCLLFVVPLVLLAFLWAYRSGKASAWALFFVTATAGTCVHLVVVQLLVGVCLAVSAITLWPNLERQPCERRWTRWLLVVLLSAAASGVGLLDLGSPESNLYLTNEFRRYDGGFVAFVRAFLDGITSAFLPETGPLSLRDLVAVILVSFAAVGATQMWREERADLALILVCAVGVPGAMMYFTLGHMFWWPWLRYVCHLVVPFGLLCVYGAEWTLIRRSEKGSRSLFSLALLVLMFPAYGAAWFSMWRDHSAVGWGLSLKVAADRGCSGAEPKLTGYFAEWDRTTDMLWFNSVGCERPPVFLLSPETRGAVRVQFDAPVPGSDEALPRYRPVAADSIRPGRYLLASAVWLSADCTSIGRDLGGLWQSTDVTSSEPDLARFPNLKLCEVGKAGQAPASQED